MDLNTMKKLVEYTEKLSMHTVLADALDRFESAVEEYSWRGGKDPESVPDIEEEYYRAKINIISYLLRDKD